eukprot:TRINITY_DN8634_c0_g1_i1.p1 TRINITY_DN8634_c0_g1~~TRINITY_DN8634_c0_g1_i1.p1  ORF type:complete len:1167 (+),score=170.71 TRINITY_DN8634_c0_g1_i1:26-3502(+)
MAGDLPANDIAAEIEQSQFSVDGGQSACSAICCVAVVKILEAAFKCCSLGTQKPQTSTAFAHTIHQNMLRFITDGINLHLAGAALEHENSHDLLQDPRARHLSSKLADLENPQDAVLQEGTPVRPFLDMIEGVLQGPTETAPAQAVLLTKTPETVLLVWAPCLERPFLLFDSHSQGEGHGACLRWFAQGQALAEALAARFRYLNIVGADSVSLLMYNAIEYTRVRLRETAALSHAARVNDTAAEAREAQISEDDTASALTAICCVAAVGLLEAVTGDLFASPAAFQKKMQEDMPRFVSAGVELAKGAGTLVKAHDLLKSSQAEEWRTKLADPEPPENQGELTFLNIINRALIDGPLVPQLPRAVLLTNQQQQQTAGSTAGSTVKAVLLAWAPFFGQPFLLFDPFAGNHTARLCWFEKREDLAARLDEHFPREAVAVNPCEFTKLRLSESPQQATMHTQQHAGSAPGQSTIVGASLAISLISPRLMVGTQPLGIRIEWYSRFAMRSDEDVVITASKNIFRPLATYANLVQVRASTYGARKFSDIASESHITSDTVALSALIIPEGFRVSVCLPASALATLPSPGKVTFTIRAGTKTFAGTAGITISGNYCDQISRCFMPHEAEPLGKFKGMCECEDVEFSCTAIEQFMCFCNSCRIAGEFLDEKKEKTQRGDAGTVFDKERAQGVLYIACHWDQIKFTWRKGEPRNISDMLYPFAVTRTSAMTRFACKNCHTYVLAMVEEGDVPIILFQPWKQSKDIPTCDPRKWQEISRDRTSFQLLNMSDLTFWRRQLESDFSGHNNNERKWDDEQLKEADLSEDKFPLKCKVKWLEKPVKWYNTEFYKQAEEKIEWTTKQEVGENGNRIARTGTTRGWCESGVVSDPVTISVSQNSDIIGVSWMTYSRGEYLVGLDETNFVSGPSLKYFLHFDSDGLVKTTDGRELYRSYNKGDRFQISLRNGRMEFQRNSVVLYSQDFDDNELANNFCAQVSFCSAGASVADIRWVAKKAEEKLRMAKDALPWYEKHQIKLEPGNWPTQFLRKRHPWYSCKRCMDGSAFVPMDPASPLHALWEARYSADRVIILPGVVDPGNHHTGKTVVPKQEKPRVSIKWATLEPTMGPTESTNDWTRAPSMPRQPGRKSLAAINQVNEARKAWVKKKKKDKE